MDLPGWVRKSANLHIQDGRHGTNIISYCIGNKPLIVEGGDFYICYANVRSSLVYMNSATLPVPRVSLPLQELFCL